MSCQWCSSEWAGWAREWKRYRWTATSLSQNPHRNLPSQQQSSSPGFYSSFRTPCGVKRSADVRCVRLVSADALLHPPLLLGQIELQNISMSQVIIFAWDSQRLASTVSIFLLLWGDEQRWRGSAGFVGRAASDQPDINSPCYHANNSLIWKWPTHDWFHGPRDNANRKKCSWKVSYYF